MWTLHLSPGADSDGHYVTRDSIGELNINSRVLLQRFYWSRML